MASTWVKVATNITEHPKMMRVPRVYRWAFIELLCYCGRNLTDGEIPGEYARRNCEPEELEALASAGFIYPSEHGYRIHDYLDWQTPGEEVREKNEKRARAGRLGGLRSGEARRAQATKQTAKQNGT